MLVQMSLRPKPFLKVALHPQGIDFRYNDQRFSPKYSNI